MSRMQESLCLGNNNYKMPFWLPSSNKTAHRCYLALRNDYILVNLIFFNFLKSALLNILAKGQKGQNNVSDRHFIS